MKNKRWMKIAAIVAAGGTTVTSEGTFDPENQWEETGAGQTAHVDQDRKSVV